MAMFFSASVTVAVSCSLSWAREIIELMKQLPRESDLIDVLRTVVSALELYEPTAKDISRDASLRTAIKLTAQFPTIVAASERIRDALGWHPRYDDLSTIVAHALAWERQLMARFPHDTRSRGLVETA